MSLISVDFISLSQQIEHLTMLKDDIRAEIDRIELVINSIAYMELYEAEDELWIVMRRLLDSADEIDKNIKKLRRILDLYNECENEILQIVYELPLNMPFNPIFQYGSVFPHGKIDMLPFIVELGTNSFGSHSIVNDEWLNDLIY